MSVNVDTPILLGTPQQEDAFGGMNAGLLTQEDLIRVQLGEFFVDPDFPTLEAMVQAAITWGVDVSDHNGVVAWKRLWDAGVRFAGIKASEGPYPGGGRFTAKTYATNSQQAKALGMGRAPYLFLVKNNVKVQADHFFDVAGTKNWGRGKVPLIDAEVYPGFPRLTPTWGVIRDMIREVRRRIGPDPKILVYSGKGFMDTMGEPDLSGFENVLLWDAAYYLGFRQDGFRDLWDAILRQGFRPFAADRWGHERKRISQYTSTGQIGNFFTGDVDAMRGEWADTRRFVFGMS